MSKTSGLVCVADFEREALNILPRNAKDYYKSGADDELTLCENVAAYKRLRIIPRVLRDVSNVSVGGLKLVSGEQLPSPICVAPTAMHGLAHGDAEFATANACAKSGTLMTVSTLSNVHIDKVAQKVPSLKRWLQLYIYKDLTSTLNFVKQAEKSGYTAVAITVDTPYLGKRRADERNKFSLPPHLNLDNFELRFEGQTGSGLAEYVEKIQNHSLNWDHIKWLRRETSMKIVLKGIQCGEDAKLAVDAGVDAIWVSNHGGRQLDSVPATIELLPEIVKAVKRNGNGRKPQIYVDGGIRTGTDVFKALALGADAVFVGRPVLWGLSVAGEEGVTCVLNILNSELKTAMALSGCTTLHEINSDFIRHQSSFCKL